MNQETSHDTEALTTIISALKLVEDEDRMRILRAAATFLELETGHISPKGSAPHGIAETSAPARPFSEQESMTPKEFLIDKEPRTDVERIACLTYYLTHYRDTPHFKTLDIGKLNTEAAQPKFANAANSTNNALKQGYLVQASKGQRQLSAAGEQFVLALPDRDQAKSAMNSFGRRKSRNRKRPNSAKGNS